MTGREGPGPERPGPDYPPEWDTEPAEEDRCACSTWWVDPDTGREYDQGGGDRVRMYSSEPHLDCPVHAPTEEPADGPAPVVVPDPWQQPGSGLLPPF